MVTNATATIYRPLTDGSDYDRVYIDSVMWQGSQSKTLSTGGTKDAANTNIFIPLDLIDHIPTGSYIVCGECEYIYSTEHPIREFTKCYKPLTVLQVTKCDYGTADMQHWEVIAR